MVAPRSRADPPAPADQDRLVIEQGDPETQTDGIDEGRLHRRGPRLSGVSHPATPEAGSAAPAPLCLPFESRPDGRERDGPDADPAGHRPTTAYSRHGVCKASFNYLHALVWRRVMSWLRRKHARSTWTELRRRYLPGWWPTEGEARLFDPATVTVSRYRYRTASPRRGSARLGNHRCVSWRAGCVATRTSGSEGGPGRRIVGNDDTAPRSDANDALRAVRTKRVLGHRVTAASTLGTYA